MNTNISHRIDMLRKWLIDIDCDALIIPHEDEFLGEYLPAHNERLFWATGFTGSAGAAVITRSKAAIFVDGRYTVQVTNQAPSDLFEYCHLIEQPYLEWLNQHVDQVTKVAYDPRMHTSAWLSHATKALSSQITLVAVNENPVDACWLDRPTAQLSTMRLMDSEFSGQSTESKISDVSKLIQDSQCDAAILTQLDSICWLLNIRGLDISRLPVLLSYAIIYADNTVELYLDPQRVHKDFDQHVNGAVQVIHPKHLSDNIKKLKGKSVWFSSHSSNAWFALQMQESGVLFVEGKDPCAMFKAVKNPTEVQGIKDCHVKDGVAMVKFLSWLDNEVSLSNLHNEAILAEKLQDFRFEDPQLVDLSFDTISAAGPNAAMCHYNHINQDSPGSLRMDSLYLVDSGGQYPNGTTDITRTVAIGAPTYEMKRLFTLVLKGHIGLSNAIFPKGTTGIQLDSLARQHLWKYGYDYDHGTGHGVGHFLSVHEGPQNISKRANPTPLVEGMVVSNEPGYYKENSFGIRIENLVLVTKRETGGDFSALGFEPLTLCPIDKRNILTELMSDTELLWLNEYHQKVYDVLAPFFEQPTLDWLHNATQPLCRSNSIFE
jgi:Xaa-Pro aminopeptidase